MFPPMRPQERLTIVTRDYVIVCQVLEVREKSDPASMPDQPSPPEQPEQPDTQPDNHQHTIAVVRVHKRDASTH